MLKREVLAPPEHLFPPDDWRLVEARWSERYSLRTETVFALSNGYIGVRGTVEEGRPAASPGTFIGGFHETWPMTHAEPAYGLSRTGQSIVNVPDATVLQLYVDDEPLYLPTARTPEYQRVLDFREGTLSRDLVWSTGSGKHIGVSSWRLVSLDERHLMAMQYVVTSLDHDASLVVTSQLVNRQDASAASRERREDPRLSRVFSERVLQCEVASQQERRMLVGYRTAHSAMTLGVGVDHVVETDSPHRTAVSLNGDLGELVLTVDAVAGSPVTITKYVTYHSSRGVPPEELVARAARALDRAVAGGTERLRVRQREHLDRFWDRADVKVDSARQAARTQQAVRWNLYQLAQATWCAQGCGVPAKGLTSQTYDGHYFWDSEIYLLPFLAYTQPRLARNLLRFRYSMLDRARARAREMSQRGAMFPWRTINGEEASGNFQSGTAQYHINADIAFAMQHYARIRGDDRFLAELGAEVLVETARLWQDLGFFGADGQFHIHGVTGPDEYTTVVNDNTYTNLMARENLRSAAETVRWLQRDRPADHTALLDAVDLQPGEVATWEAAADAMYVPFDAARGMHPQDDAFFEREVWDLENTQSEAFPLLLHHHPLVIYRFQVLKQADIVLAMYLLGDQFSAEQKLRNFDYYDQLTTGDSSLSACVQSIVAAEVGRDREALEYFGHALLIDLADVGGDFPDGVHIASAAGVWSALVHGFGGVRISGGTLSLAPRLPRYWRSLDFSLRFHGRQLRVHLSPTEETYLVDEGEPLEVTLRGVATVLSPGVKVVRPAPHRGQTGRLALTADPAVSR
jgi:alpha,alpha-trehalose phosphorylase